MLIRLGEVQPKARPHRPAAKYARFHAIQALVGRICDDFADFGCGSGRLDHIVAVGNAAGRDAGADPAIAAGELRAEIRGADLETALADSLYSGYIEKQKLATERVNHHDALKVPESFQFSTISGLSNEMVERLERARPQNFGQVRKIHGLTPAAVSTVLVHLTAYKPENALQN